jgi:hypothetical protein
LALELIFGGCQLFGDERDPTFGCLDSDYSDAATSVV